jgi:hypothetical protein
MLQFYYFVKKSPYQINIEISTVKLQINYRFTDLHFKHKLIKWSHAFLANAHFNIHVTSTETISIYMAWI